MNRLPFSDWLREIIVQNRFTEKIYWSGGSLTLEEKDGNFHMLVKIENVDKRFVVFNFDNGVNQGLYFKRIGDALSKRCDFVIFEETDSGYTAYLVELKSQVPDRDGATQFKWSEPYFRYILSVFLADSLLLKSEKELEIKFFQIGKDYSQWYKKRFMGRQRKQKFTWHCDFAGPDFLFCTYQGHRLEFNDFRQG